MPYPGFNGMQIIPMPSDPPVPRNVEWQTVDLSGATLNPFTGQQQTQDWQNARLEASLLYQKMTNSQAIAWAAFLHSLRGRVNAFQFGDPLNRGPQNPAAVAPTVSGSGQTGFLLNTVGGSGLMPGDWIQIGYRLYRLTSVNQGQLGIWPNLRESPANGTPIQIQNTQGLWKLKANDQKFSVKETKLYGFTLEIREAI
ncbi:MAG: hypothetical protein KGL39_51075 [Patescibacteria group bacterium]|nr:hypothetical protein [Patescibacteria group bacterium]